MSSRHSSTERNCDTIYSNSIYTVYISPVIQVHVAITTPYICLKINISFMWFEIGITYSILSTIFIYKSPLLSLISALAFLHLEYGSPTVISFYVKTNCVSELTRLPRSFNFMKLFLPFASG